ncbi:hypothetical protein [Streptomyces sp. NPDC020141]|uniref:hypothetical protein n=1 Tax=Streptomyces sp. NPDC020141 TaxID=3365065 RepID=UPI0037B9744F
MESTTSRPSGIRSDLLWALAGAVFALAATGCALAITDADSSLRAPLALLFLFTGPAGGLYAVTRGLDPAIRATAAGTGATGTLLLASWLHTATGPASATGGIALVAAVTALLFAATAVRHRRGERPKGETDRTDGRG